MFKSVEELDVDEIPDDMLDIITGELIVNPVRASDGRSYSKRGIEQWIATCKRNYVPVTSPWTREVISERLERDYDLDRRINQFKKELELKRQLYIFFSNQSQGAIKQCRPVSVEIFRTDSKPSRKHLHDHMRNRRGSKQRINYK